MKIKTSELISNALDFVVASLEYPEWVAEGYLESVDDLVFDDGEVYAPSTDWAQAGPIIERERINIRDDGGDQWAASYLVAEMIGPTPLVAAMRCYVASKLGDEVEVPEDIQP